MNPRLFVKNPDQSELGKNIVRTAVAMICKMGFEDFTFKKLAAEIGTTEASIYRYFENKHRLLTYIIAWYWTWLEYQLIFHTNNVTSPKDKILTVIKLLTFQLADTGSTDNINKTQLYQISITEGSKPYLTKHVTQDNRNRLFKPYKDLCGRIAEIFKEYNKAYKYPRSLASTLLEMCHYQFFFKDNLPSLTDFANESGSSGIVSFLENLIFSSLDAGAASRAKSKGAN